MRIRKTILLLVLSAALMITPLASAADQGTYVFLDGEEVSLTGAAAFF